MYVCVCVTSCRLMGHVATITGPENGGNMILRSDGDTLQLCTVTNRT
jgi:hypothetical protein